MRLRVGDEGGGDLLESIPLAGEPTDGDSGPTAPVAASGRRRRWPIIVVVVALVLVVVAFPVRVKVNGQRASALEQRWLAARAVVDERASLINDLKRRVTDADSRDLTDVTRALDLEVATILDDRARALRGMLLLDTGLRKTRDAMAEWMHLQAIDLRVHDLQGSYLTVAARAHGHRLLADQHRRSKVAAAGLKKPPPPLRSADRLKATLSHFLDERTGVTLIATDGVLIHTIDIDASSDDVRPPGGTRAVARWGFPNPLILRSDYLALVSERGVVKIPLVGDVNEQVLGTADWAFPGARADTIWLARQSGSDYNAEEVDGAGVLVRDTVTTKVRPLAEVGTGLLGTLDRGNTIAVVDNASGAVRTIAEQADYLAASSTHVAWMAFDGPNRNTRLHVRSLTDGSEHTSDDISAEYTVRAEFSPDGRLLATVANTSMGPPQQVALRVLDVTTGVMTPVRGPAGSDTVNAIVWSPDGDRVFIATGDRSPLATWAIGEDSLRQIRLAGLTVRGLVATRSR